MPKLMAEAAELATSLSLEDENFLCLELFKLYESKLFLKRLNLFTSPFFSVHFQTSRARGQPLQL